MLDILTSSNDSDFHMNKENDTCDANDTDAMVQIPTINVGEVEFHVDEETKYGGSLGNYKISGHVLLNQVGTVLTRKKIRLEESARITILFKEFILPRMYLQFH